MITIIQIIFLLFCSKFMFYTSREMTEYLVGEVDRKSGEDKLRRVATTVILAFALGLVSIGLVIYKIIVVFS